MDWPSSHRPPVPGAAQGLQMQDVARLSLVTLHLVEAVVEVEEVMLVQVVITLYLEVLVHPLALLPLTACQLLLVVTTL